MSEDNQHK